MATSKALGNRQQRLIFVKSTVNIVHENLLIFCLRLLEVVFEDSVFVCRKRCNIKDYNNIVFSIVPTYYIQFPLSNRAVANLTAPGGHEFRFPHFSSNFDQFF